MRITWGGKQSQFLYVSPATNAVVVRLGGGEDTLEWLFAIQALVHALP